MAAGALAYVVVCTTAENPCTTVNQSVVQAYLIDPLYQIPADTVLSQLGLDWDMVYDGFGLSLSLFVVGLCVGVVINVVRKAR